jgi:hypothetical protein
MDTKIQREEVVSANRRPNESTLNPKSIPGNIVKKLHSILFPAKTMGTMERMIKNWKRLARRVQSSLKFGRLPDNKIRIAPDAGQMIANKGLTDSMVSIMVFLPIQT